MTGEAIFLWIFLSSENSSPQRSLTEKRTVNIATKDDLLTVEFQNIKKKKTSSLRLKDFIGIFYDDKYFWRNKGICKTRELLGTAYCSNEWEFTLGYRGLSQPDLKIDVPVKFLASPLMCTYFEEGKQQTGTLAWIFVITVTSIFWFPNILFLQSHLLNFLWKL